MNGAGARLAHGLAIPHGERAGDGAQGRQPWAEPLRRDEDRERRVLVTASGVAAAGDWHELVAARLEQGQRDYGDAWAERSAADLAAEAIEEAADLAAWSLLAEQALDAGDIDSPTADRVRRLLSGAISSAARAHVELEAALRLLDCTRSER